VPIPPASRTDQELSRLDVPALLRAGFGGAADAAGAGRPGGAGDSARAELFGGGAVAAAITADRLGVLPRSLTFLAEIVRRGGVGYAATLPEPLPGAERTALARSWLAAVAGSTAGAATAAGDEFARWLEAVAVILGVRQHSAPPPG
jgi:hypothetical protein